MVCFYLIVLIYLREIDFKKIKQVSKNLSKLSNISLFNDIIYKIENIKKLPDNCVDLIFTSPPYNFGLNYNENADDHYWQDYFNQLFKIFDECIRVIKYGGRIIINIPPLFSDYIPSHNIISNYFLNKKRRFL